MKLPKKLARPSARPVPPSRAETIVGVVILVIVAGVGVAVYLAGQSYDPALFRVDPELLRKSESGTAPVAVEEGQRRSTRDGEPAVAGSGAVPGAEALVDDGALLSSLAAGEAWPRRGGLQRFAPANLYDKVDGRENLYKEYGFQELVVADYVARDAVERFIQVELFDQGSPRGARAVYMAERPGNARPMKLGKEGYLDANGAFFWKGRYYARIIGSDTRQDTRETALVLARNVASRLKDEEDPTMETASADPLPLESRVANSLTFIGESAFGQSFLRDVTSARYQIEGLELVGFVMKTESATRAAAVIEAFRKAMASFGALQPVEVSGSTMHYIEVAGSHYVMFAKGANVGGVMEAEAKDPAIELARRIAARLP
jgi:hypothetical protein